MAEPDQGGGPTWGALAIPSQMTSWNPGVTVLGGLATDTALSAKRAQNLAAFEAYQKMNPGATAADLSQAAERLTGGDNFFGADATGDIMKELAEKNQLQLRSDQSRQQTDINAGYTQAMEQAIATAETPDDWVAKTKSLLAPSAASTFDAYMVPKDTTSMFRVYQQKRVMPIVDIGIKAGWDTPDEYTTAAGGNAALGKMAYDLAKPSVDAQKLEASDKHGLTLAQVGAEHAREAAGYASAAASGAQANEANTQTQALLTGENAKRIQFLNEQLADPLVGDAIATKDPANLDQAKQAAHDRYVGIFGTTHEDDFVNWWKTAPAEVAERIAAQKNAQALQMGQILFDSQIAAPTAGLRAQMTQGKDSLYGVDQNVYKGLDESDPGVRQAISNTRALLADKDVAVTDTTLFKKIVAEDTVAGKSLSDIQRHLESTLGSTGLPIYGNSTVIQSQVNARVPGGGAVATSAPELQQQISSSVRDVVIQTDGLINTLTKPKGAGGLGGVNIPASIQTVTGAVTKSLSQIDASIAQIRDRNSTGLVYDKDKSTITYLLNQRTMVEDKARELRRVLDKRKDLAAPVATSKVEVNGGGYDVNTDLSTVDPATVKSALAQVSAIANRRLAPKGDHATFDNRFLPYLQGNPDAARLAALAAQEVARIRQQSGTVGVPSLKMGQFSRSAPPPPQGLSPLQIGQIVGQVIGGNIGNLDWKQEDRAFLQDQITRFLVFSAGQ